MNFWPGQGELSGEGRSEVSFHPFCFFLSFPRQFSGFSFVTGHKQCVKILNLNLLRSGHIMSFIIVKSLSLTCRMWGTLPEIVHWWSLQRSSNPRCEAITITESMISEISSHSETRSFLKFIAISNLYVNVDLNWHNGEATFLAPKCGFSCNSVPYAIFVCWLLNSLPWHFFLGTQIFPSCQKKLGLIRSLLNNKPHCY